MKKNFAGEKQVIKSWIPEVGDYCIITRLGEDDKIPCIRIRGRNLIPVGGLMHFVDLSTGRDFGIYRGFNSIEYAPWLGTVETKEEK